MCVPGAMTATSAAMVRMNPADAARAPDGPTNTTTGARDAIIRETMSRVESSRPPGVRRTITTTSAPAASAWVIASSMYSAAMGWMMPSSSATTAVGVCAGARDWANWSTGQTQRPMSMAALIRAMTQFYRFVWPRCCGSSNAEFCGSDIHLSRRTLPVRRIDRATVIGTVSAAALFVCTAFIGAQAPAAPQTTAPQTAAPAAPQAPAPAGRGGLPGTESGWATFQGQCYGCHRNESPDGTPTAWSIRQLTPERIFESLAGRESWRRQAQRHSEDSASPSS